MKFIYAPNAGDKLRNDCIMLKLNMCLITLQSKTVVQINLSGKMNLGFVVINGGGIYRYT